MDANLFSEGAIYYYENRTNSKKDYSNENLNHDFIMLDNMEWLFKLKPSFVILLPKNSDITKKNSKLNVEIIYPKQASTKMNFNIVSSGSADLNTYFFQNHHIHRNW